MRIILTLLFFLFFLDADCQSKRYDTLISNWENRYSQLVQFKKYKMYVETNFFGLIGDFFGDGLDDYVFYIIDKANTVKLVFVNNYGREEEFHILGLKDDPFDIDDYKWAQIIRKVDKGSVLWSNYTDDFRSLNEVPENEKVYLDYDAVYLHAAESCGGGFVYWKDGKFNWLQQE